ncbi:MAG TPA: hypothetical protein VG818_00200, partial [Gemmatimonadaceae bacterium]|nr:hypothetical protein [Gemmatimonadaceae bacterium]
MRIPHQPPAAVMTLVELVERERARLLRLELAAGIALGVAVAGVVAAVGVLVLGGARWLSLPRILPFVVWAVLLLSVAVLAWNTARRLRARASRAAVAAAIEAEQALRAGALRGALEIAGSGALGRRAAEQ